MRKTAVGAALVVAALTVVALTQFGGAGREAARDVGGIVGLVDDPPFSVRLGGPLWRDRTFRDRDGAEDVALVVADRPLDVEVRGDGGARIASVELRVDGRRERVVAPRCAGRTCRSRLHVTFVPRLKRLPPGEHHVEVIARDSHAGAGSSDRGAHVSARGFDIQTVARAPVVIEGETAAKLPAAASTSHGDPVLERSALRVLAAERLRPGLGDALATTDFTVIQVGDLNVRGQRLGATMWVQLVSPRRDVRATVPGYVPAASTNGGSYTLQQVKLQVAVLRDALIDLDLTRQRVIAFEPGPRSQTLSWSPARAPSPAGADNED
jgi:hypothetical protein